MNKLLLAAVNRKIESSSGAFDPANIKGRTSFESHPITHDELGAICKACGIDDFKFRTTVDGLTALIKQDYKWRKASIVLVDAMTIDNGHQPLTPSEQVVREFEKIRNEHLREDQDPRTIFGLIPHKNVPKSDHDYLYTCGVDFVCTPEELVELVPQLLIT